MNPPVGDNPPSKEGPINQNFMPAVNLIILRRVPTDDHHNIFYDTLGPITAEMATKFCVLEDRMKDL